MQNPTHCPKCSSDQIYEYASIWTCPMCSHEFTNSEHDLNLTTEAQVGQQITDAHGNELHDGDSVTVIKDLKVKGSSSSIKVGTKVKNIRLVDSSDGHNIGCKIDGFGQMNLKSEFVKKA
ncbi:MAG: zinc ribbon domain-containing protein YjdM [Proteobacteria bacterium]|nr:zinc ribbon domain-containing protein YjdM [Pseudomonadota bacterium]